MAPHNSSPLPSQDMHSPWTDAFQTNPRHQDGHYDTQLPELDEMQAPTWNALGMVYDTDDGR